MTRRTIANMEGFKVQRIKYFEKSKNGDPYYSITIVNPEDGTEKLNLLCFEDSLAFIGIKKSMANPSLTGNLTFREGGFYNLEVKMKFESKTIDGKFHTFATFSKLLSYTPFLGAKEEAKREIKPITTIGGFGGGL